MIDRIRNIVGRIHAEQSGAIALMLLAAILILFMTALVIFDAGTAAQDKMDVQIGADSAAFSHSIVKARSMNMIAYANTVKRMIFSYLHTYINGWLAILATWAYHASQCFKWFPSIPSCITFFAAIPMIIFEGIELFATNLPTTGAMVWPWAGASPRSRSELKALEQYQQYMIAVTPWWAYVEGAMRGMMDGAMITAAWPPPGGQLSDLSAAVSGQIGGLATQLPLVTNTAHVDALPISRRDRDTTWNNPADPYQFGSNVTISNAGDYCLEHWVSLEWLVTGVQTFMSSFGQDDPDGWEWVFAGMQLIPWSLGCVFASYTYRNDNYMDWRIKNTLGNNKQRWLGATGSTHISYLPRAGRNDSTTGERQKYMYMTREAAVNNIYKNEGYFGMARSEIVYKQPHDIANTANDFISSIPVVGGLLANRLGLNDEPDMWSPRWKSKLRPVMLPGERFSSPIQSNSTVGFNKVTRDVVPYLAFGSIVGLVGPQGGDPPFSVPSAIQDFAYLVRAGQFFGTNQLQGLAK